MHEDQNMKTRWAKRGLKVGIIAVFAVAVFSFAVMSLWNWLTPAVFGFHTITFWQALGLLALSKILFGGFRGRPGHGRHWRGRMYERWEQMTPEEREKFRGGLFNRCSRSNVMAEPAD
jgi:predicted membrane chloride channel (bestrophin family)